jgi:hypothetical protein
VKTEVVGDFVGDGPFAGGGGTVDGDDWDWVWGHKGNAKKQTRNLPDLGDSRKYGTCEAATALRMMRPRLYLAIAANALKYSGNVFATHFGSLIRITLPFRNLPLSDASEKHIAMR